MKRERHTQPICGLPFLLPGEHPPADYWRGLFIDIWQALRTTREHGWGWAYLPFSRVEFFTYEAKGALAASEFAARLDTKDPQNETAWK